MKKLLLTLFCALTLVTAQETHASATPWNKTEEVSSRLLVGNLQDGVRYAGLHLKLKENWHSYWRTPGDGGMAPTLDWSGSSNVKNVEFLYPAPTRFQKTFEGFDPVETYGYADEVVFPLAITPEDAELPIDLQLAVKYAICDELCIFLNEQFSSSITAEDKDEESNALIQTYLTQVPGRNEGLTIDSLTLNDEANTLELSISSSTAFVAPDVFVEATADFKFKKPQIFFGEDKKTALVKIQYNELLSGTNLSGVSGKVTVVDAKKSTEKKLTFGEKAASAPPAEIKPQAQASEVAAPRPFDTAPPPENGGLFFIIISAFLGGLILNIMPCVLPVLSLKLVGIARHGGGNTHYVRASFLTSAAGIIISFIILAAIVISLKSAGNAVGWGFHFQQPAFVIALIIFINLFAANQWSLFEIHLPYWLGGRIANAMPQAEDHTLTGHFMTGVAAAVLATPCSAPFLGTAVGFALSRGAQEILMVFSIMGLGLAAPYLLFAIFPRFVTRLPRPGAWMVKVKHFMGYLLAATSAWLIWVLAGQLGATAALVVAVFSLISLIILHLHKLRPMPSSVMIMIVVAGLASTFTLPLLLGEHKATEEKMDKTMWMAFDEAAIPGYVAEGKVVFVDVTADWCLTCKFNKARVLHVGKVHEALMNANVITMKADYTNPSEAITTYLQKHGRYGIPFNIVYGKAAPEGITLPEYLTEKVVLDAMAQAEGKE